MQTAPLPPELPAPADRPHATLAPLPGRPMSVAEVHTMVARILGVGGAAGLLVAWEAQPQGAQAPRNRSRAALTAALVRVR